MHTSRVSPIVCKVVWRSARFHVLNIGRDEPYTKWCQHRSDIFSIVSCSTRESRNQKGSANSPISRTIPKQSHKYPKLFPAQRWSFSQNLTKFCLDSEICINWLLWFVSCLSPGVYGFTLDGEQHRWRIELSMHVTAATDRTVQPPWRYNHQSQVIYTIPYRPCWCDAPTDWDINDESKN